MFKPIVLNVLALLILSAAGFVYFKNTKAFEREQDDLVSAQNALKITKERLDEAQIAFNDTVAEDNRQKEEIVKFEAEEVDQKGKKADLEDDLRAKTNDLRFFEDNPDLINEQRDKVRIAENSMDEIKVLDKEIKELNTMVANREENLTNLTGKDDGLKENISDLKAHIASRTGGRSVEGLVSEIRAVYNSWGFVTLADGDKTGIVLNSTLDVVRGDETIAKLLVTIVEQGTASADIVPGSMAPDTFLMIGDKVVPASAGLPDKNEEKEEDKEVIPSN